MMKLLFLLIGPLFILCCTAGAETMLPHGPEISSALEALKEQKKFLADASALYPGAPDETTRIKAEGIINRALEKLLRQTGNGMTKETFWTVLETAARQLSYIDSEEMDRGLAYMEEIMDIYGIEHSSGRLNQWRYGFDPGRSP